MEEIPNIPETKVSNNTPLEPSGGRMIPLSQVLAGYAGRQALPASNSQKPGSSITPANDAQSSRSRTLYRQALIKGFLLGIIGGCAALAAFLIAGS